jgi:hypothetical protein
MHAAVILFSFLLSCGPDDCDELEFFVDLVLDEEEDLFQATLLEYRICEGECEEEFLECMELAGIVVEDNNQAPVAKAGADQTLEFQQTCWLDGADSLDPDDDLLSPTWTVVSAPGGSEIKTQTLNDANQLIASFVPDLVGKYKLRLTVDDGKLDATDTVQVTVVNSAPGTVTVTGTPDTPIVGDEVVVEVTVVDPDNDPDESADPAFEQTLSYVWTVSSVPDGSTLEKLTKDTEAAANFYPDVAGIYSVAIAISDGLETVSASLDVVVGAGFAAPEDEVDTGFVPPTEEECVAAYDTCEKPCVHPEELDYPYTKARHSPVISWTGGPQMAVSVLIAKGPAKDDVIWSVKCPNDNNCLSSPVVYGIVPPGAELNTEACKDERCDTEQRTKLVDGGYYKVSGGRDEGGKFPCVPKEENEVEFEHPNRGVYSYD